MNIFTADISTLAGLIDWRTLFDVPLMAAVIFFLYRTLRTSGAWRIVLGICVALIVYIIAQAFHFTGITWLFSNLSNIALIALIIIFQPEIRKILERAASSLRIKEMGKDAGALSAMISEAVASLARMKWGAIVVLPGKDPIRARVSGGVALNADPSVALITSIFDPHSPGHDGALVIEDGKVTMFGLRLPLSESEDLGEQFGTRHHAALGLTEHSDALVVAVSEERGSISVFHEGRYYPVEDKEALEGSIRRFAEKMSSYAPVPRGLKRRAVTVVEAGVSLILAFFLWSSIALSTAQMKEMSLTIPIEYILANSDMVVMGEKPTACRIRLNGNTSDLGAVKPQDLKATIDLTAAEAGKQVITISRGTIVLPRGVALVDADPSVFEIMLQSLAEREVPVRPQLVGAPPRGLEISSVEVNPQRVRAFYLSQEKEGREVFLTTTPIYLQNVTETTRLLCNLIAPPNIYPVDRQWPDVVVTVTVKGTR
jgi:diadenylate cyclase